MLVSGWKKIIRILRFCWRCLIILLVLDAGYLWGMMPEWDYYAQGPLIKSAFIRDYEYRRLQDTSLPALQWQPVPLQAISPNLMRAVLVAEDSRFFQHNGIDTDALRSAMEYNLAKQKLVYGGSTISQQLTKNLFLTPSRNPLRKWHELWLTLALEHALSKQRILELYLNVAEFGQGLYGAEAAAEYYWNCPAGQLSMAQSIALAATLTSPVKHNPHTRTDYFRSQQMKIRSNMGL